MTPIKTTLYFVFLLLSVSLLLAGCDAMGPKVSKKLPLEAEIIDDATRQQDAVIFDELAKKESDEQPPEPAVRLYPGSGDFIGTTLPARPAKRAGQKGRYTLNFDDADLGEVAKVVLGDTLNQSYTINPKVAGRVTLQTTQPLTKEELIPTLEMVLRMNGVVLLREKGLYRLEPAATALSATPTPGLGRPGQRLPPGYRVQIIPLRYVGVSEMQKILEPLLPPKAIVRADVNRNLLTIAGTAAELENILDTIAIFDVDMMQGMSVGLYSLRNVDAATLIPELTKLFGEEADSPLAGMFRMVPIERLNALMVITPQPAYLDQAKLWIDRLDSATTGSSGGVQVYRVKNVSAVELAATLNEIFGGRTRKAEIPSASVAPGLKPKQISGEKRQSTKPKTPSKGSISLADVGEVRIIADEPNNSIVVVATAQEYEVIERVIKRLDVVPLQVLIDANIVEVTLADRLEYGLKWFIQHGSTVQENNRTSGGRSILDNLSISELTTAAADGAQAGGLTYAFLNASEKLGVLFTALAEDNKLNVISSPSLMVLNNQEATIKVGNQISLRTSESTNTSSSSADPVRTSQFQQRDTGVELTVKPRVNPGGLVIMEIEQKVDTVGDPQAGSDNPSIFQRQINSSVAVQHGETLVLGGLISDTRDNNKSGIPILSKIPLLGPLFRSTTKSLDRTELVVLITPRVVKDRVDARKITLEFKRKLTGIYEDEQQNNESSEADDDTIQ